MESQPVRGLTGGGGDNSGNGIVSGGVVEGVYQMGVYLCLGQAAFGMGRSDSVSLWSLRNTGEEIGGVEELVSRYLDAHGGCGFFYMGEGENRVKKEAEQAACKSALEAWGRFTV